MARTKNLNDKLAPKLEESSLPTPGRVLAYIGKPFYLILSYLFIGLVFSIYFVGNKTLQILKLLFKKAKDSISSFKKLVKSFKKASVSKKRIKVTLPKFSFPKPPSIQIPKPRLSKKVVVLFLLLAAGFSFWNFILKELPSPKKLATRDLEVSTKIYDRNGELLYKIYKDKNRTVVPLEEIPMHVRLATLAAEDAEFYLHPGFSVRGMLRAILRNATRGELTGGSTITQQLVKNALLTPEKTVTRKIREIILAMGVEIIYSKDEILEMYLNEVAYGGTAYGIQEAARVYFDKDVQDLTISEAAFLAGLPKSPTKFSPFGPNPEAGLARQKDIINLMLVNKFINEEQAKTALNQELSFSQNKIDIKAPHFVMYVREKLVDKYGEEVVETGGLEVYTTLDYSIQKMAERVVKEEISNLDHLNVTNGAALVISPETGEILAMVGSKDYFDIKNDGNVNVVTRPRQPGSSIKVVNYAYALQNGYTPATIIDDSPVTFSIPGQEPYSPRNYDGRYRGKIPLRSALAESRNIPAVKVLATYGVDKMIEMGKKMGITTWGDRSRFGLSLTLGGGEVTLIDLSKAYTTVANYGKRTEFQSITKVTNYKGKVLEENSCVASGADEENTETIKLAGLIKRVKAAEAAATKCQKESVLDPRVAFLLIDILKDNIARAPAFGSFSQLVIPNHPEIAVKTGTSNDLRDNLTVGFNKDYLVSVWVGNNNNSPMSRVASGVTGASPIFNKIMTNLVAGKQSHEWPVPEGVTRVAICPLTGTLPCKGCQAKNEWFLEETKPQYACNPEQLIATQDEERQKEGSILPEAAQTQNQQERRRFFFSP